MGEAVKEEGDLAERLMLMSVEIAWAEIAARRSGSLKEAEAVGRQKEKLVGILRLLISSRGDLSPAEPLDA
jgi:hypothetical protein